MQNQLVDLTEKALALPVEERTELARKIWESLEEKTIEQAKQRDAELSSGSVVGRSHDDVMQSAKDALK